MPEQPSSLQMPSFFHGTRSTVHQKARKEGARCGEQYLKDGSFPPPRQMLEVPPGEVVLVHEVTDFQHERPAWRLYMVSDVLGGLYEALDWQNVFPVRDAYEAFCRESAWGALYFVVSPTGPVSAQRTALRLQAMLRFWDTLQSARYLFKTLDAVLTLEELIKASCDWAMDAWCPLADASIHMRLEMAANRMARATREESLERAMKEGHSWEGNWKVVRLYERVRERGYDSLTAFAEARPILPLVELAQELGGDDINDPGAVECIYSSHP